MNRVLAVAVAAVVLVAGVAAFSLLPAPSQDREQLYQMSSLNALVHGDYRGAGTVGSLLSHGGVGLGTFEGLDGEMIVIDGRCYQASADGAVREMSPSAVVSFAQVTFFDADGTVPLTGRLSTAAAEDLPLQSLPSEDAFFVITIHGTFDNMTVRSVPKQSEPYPPLSDVVANQTIFHYPGVTGTVVGLWSPAFTTGLSSAGFHFHFISDDRTVGGHVLSFDLTDLEAQWDQTLRYVVELP